MAMTIVENHLLSVTGGYRRLVAWLAGFGDIDLVGVEGTGSHGAGIARYLTGEGIRVVEVDRPNRQARHRAGKTDAVDAISAARAALSGTATGMPKTRTGPIEAIRVLTVARRSATSEWVVILNQMRHLCFTAPDELRRRFEDLSPILLVRTDAHCSCASRRSGSLLR
jgi:transposase